MNMKSTMEHDRIAHEIETYYITDGCYASNWGATDLYEDAEKNLRELLTKKGEFRTSWCGSKKELQSFRLIFDDEKIMVQVTVWMDELYEDNGVIMDALWDIEGNEDELDDEDIEHIRDICWDGEVRDEVDDWVHVKRDITYEELMDCISEMIDRSEDFLTGEYERVKSIVSYYLEHEKESKGEDDDE